jgi:hypothetical protein
METTPPTLRLKVTPLAAYDPAPDALVPEIVLPAQLRWGTRQDSQTSGPRALMLALLEDAIRCVLVPHVSERDARDAEAWIREDDTDWPMSFLNVCEALGFAPARLRAAVLSRARRFPAGAEPPIPWTLHLRRARGGTATICPSSGGPSGAERRVA